MRNILFDNSAEQQDRKINQINHYWIEVSSCFKQFVLDWMLILINLGIMSSVAKNIMPSKPLNLESFWISSHFLWNCQNPNSTSTQPNIT